MSPLKGRSKRENSGQALVEFAIIAVFLLMLIFLVIDVARVGWAWVTVQGAARSSARYASTGRADCQLPPNRLDCIIGTAQDHMDVLDLADDPEAPWGSDTAYRIEVLGVDENNQGPFTDFPGAPGKLVVVRIRYWVPIVTPLFRPIAENIPVFGQVTMTNEQFDSLGGSSAGVGLPPPLPPLPTMGPSPTPTPCASAIKFLSDYVVAGEQTPVTVTGPPGEDLYLWRFGPSGVTQLASVNMVTTVAECIAEETVSGVPWPGTEFDVLQVCNGDGSICYDTIPYIAATPTPTQTATATPVISPTPTATSTVAPGSTATATPTATATATPADSFFVLTPRCGPEGTSFAIAGFNWTVNGNVDLNWDGSFFQSITANSVGSFSTSFTVPSGSTDGAHTVSGFQAISNRSFNATFTVPCPNTPTPAPTSTSVIVLTPTNTATPTATLIPADLIISAPILVAPLPEPEEYEPVEFSVVITNTGEVDIITQFFVGLYFDPTPPISTTVTISDTYRVFLTGIGSLLGGESKTVGLFAHDGFVGAGSHDVYAVVDSQQSINEMIETNNVSVPLAIDVLTGPTPTPSLTPTPGSTAVPGQVAGIAYVWLNNQMVEQANIEITATDGDNEFTAFTDTSGIYQISPIPPGTYTLVGCINLDGTDYSGSFSGASVLSGQLTVVHLYLFPATCPV